MSRQVIKAKEAVMLPRCRSSQSKIRIRLRKVQKKRKSWQNRHTKWLMALIDNRRAALVETLTSILPSTQLCCHCTILTSRIDRVSWRILAWLSSITTALNLQVIQQPRSNLSISRIHRTSFIWPKLLTKKVTRAKKMRLKVSPSSSATQTIRRCKIWSSSLTSNSRKSTINMDMEASLRRSKSRHPMRRKAVNHLSHRRRLPQQQGESTLQVPKRPIRQSTQPRSYKVWLSSSEKLKSLPPLTKYWSTCQSQWISSLSSRRS